MEWQSWVVVLTGILILIPNVFLPLYRANEFKREHIRVLQACSPQLHPYWDDVMCDNNGEHSHNFVKSIKTLPKNIVQPFFR
jgi:hypothetical protein